MCFEIHGKVLLSEKGRDSVGGREQGDALSKEEELSAVRSESQVGQTSCKRLREEDERSHTQSLQVRGYDGWLGLLPWLDEGILRIGEMHLCACGIISRGD